MPNLPVTSRLVAEPWKNDICYRCGGPTEWLIHDSRGCRVACEGCRRWRELQSVVTGHGKDCPGTLATKETK